MTARNISTIVRWDGEITGSSTAVSYIGGEVMGIFVSEEINFTGLLEEMYDLTQWDRRVFSINIICRFPRGAGWWEAYPIRNDAMTKWIFDPRNTTQNVVELFLEKVERPMVDNFGERIGAHSDPPHSMATQNVDGVVEECGAGPSNENRVLDIDEVGVENLPSRRSVFSMSNAPEEDTNEFENEIMASEAGEGEDDDDDDDNDDDVGGAHDDDDDDDVGGAHDDLHVQVQLMHGNTDVHPNRPMNVNNNLPGVYNAPSNYGARLYIGQRFRSKGALLNTVKECAIANHWQHETLVSNPTQVTLKCIKSHCPWRLRACIKKGTSYFQITRFVNSHTCAGQNTSRDHRQLDSNFICDIVRGAVKAQISTTPASIQAQIFQDFQYHISYCKAWKAKHKAIEQLFGNWEESYATLPRYLEAVKVSNPGTVYEFEYVELQVGVHQFKRVFWAFGPSIVGFQQCRNVLSIDGTHLYGKYVGKLLIANGVDGNNEILPVAFAIVESENRSSWAWFFDSIRRLVGLRDGLCVISDWHDGLVAAMKRPSWRPPRAYHRFCTRHLASNFNKKFNDGNLKDLMYNAAVQKNALKFDNVMKEIQDINPGARQWLDDLTQEQWALAYDGGHRFGIMTTNISESFNGVLKDARCLPITALVEHTFRKVNSYFCERRNIAFHSIEKFTPDVTLELTKNEQKARNHFVVIHDHQQALCEVTSRRNRSTYSGGHLYTVRVRQQECTCNKWQLLGIPCSHAIAACLCLNLDFESFVPNWCTVEAYRQAYATIFEPVPDLIYWPPHNGPKLIPSYARRYVGRPGSSRVHNEMDEREKGEPSRCSVCKQPGHNRRKCQRVRVQ